VGSEAVAEKLANSEEFRLVRVVQSHPSINVNSFRECSYTSGKIVLVPPLPGHDFLYIFVCVNQIPAHQRAFASTKRGFNKYDKPVWSLLDIPEIDLVVVAYPVACASTGARLDKGAGYGEVE